MKHLKRLGLVFLFGLLLIEGTLRYLGFAHPLLYAKTPLGYVVRPNQNLTLLGKTIRTNSQSQRSDEPNPEKRGILVLGDSISFGGVTTDQAETWPAMLERILNTRLASDIQVLNASAGGWSVFNAAEYVRMYGVSQAKLVIWQMGTLDLFQPRAASDVIDVHPSFPSTLPLCAITYMAQRYLMPRLGWAPNASDPGTGKGSGIPSLDEILLEISMVHQSVRQASATMIILFVPQPSPHEPQNPEANHARQRLLAFANEQQIGLLNFSPELRKPESSLWFRDAIHPNPSGNQALASFVADGLIAASLLNTRPENGNVTR